MTADQILLELWKEFVVSSLHNRLCTYLCICMYSFIKYFLPDVVRDPPNPDGCFALNCEHNCELVRGSAVCTCAPGYQLQTDGRTCNDINECSYSRGGCEQICLNAEGFFYCDCYRGFWLDPDGHTCNNAAYYPKPPGYSRPTYYPPRGLPSSHRPGYSSVYSMHGSESEDEDPPE